MGKPRVHFGIYDHQMRGRYHFIFAFTYCTGQVWYKTTGNWRKVTCKRCRAKAKPKPEERK